MERIALIGLVVLLTFHCAAEISFFAEGNKFWDYGLGTQLGFERFAFEFIYYPEPAEEWSDIGDYLSGVDVTGGLSDQYNSDADFNTSAYMVNALWYFTKKETGSGAYGGLGYAHLSVEASWDVRASYLRYSYYRGYYTNYDNIHYQMDSDTSWVNTFAGYRLASKHFFIDGRIGYLIGLTSDVSGDFGGQGYSSWFGNYMDVGFGVGADSTPRNDFYASILLGIKF